MLDGNPALSTRVFERNRVGEGRMTVEGTAFRGIVLLFLMLLPAGYMWQEFFSTGTLSPGLMWAGILGGLVVGIITCVSPQISPVTAPIYAVLEGLAIGGISAMYEKPYPGIVMNAAAITIIVLGIMLVLYTTRILQATPAFVKGVVAATGAICLLYLLNIVLSLFGVQMPLLHENSWVGILISVGIVIVAALNFVIDFDQIEKGAARGAPMYMSWYAAFGLFVTLIWLYLEVLRLLAKARSKN